MGSDHLHQITDYISDYTLRTTNQPTSRTPAFRDEKSRSQIGKKKNDNRRKLITSDIISDDINTFNNNIVQAINNAAAVTIAYDKLNPNQPMKYKYLLY